MNYNKTFRETLLEELKDEDVAVMYLQELYDKADYPAFERGLKLVEVHHDLTELAYKLKLRGPDYSPFKRTNTCPTS